jgi:hypothetical protein
MKCSGFTLAFVIFFALSFKATAWHFADQLNLAWPPASYVGYITPDEALVGTHNDGNIFATCSNVADSINQFKRTPFPITGGRLQFELLNMTETALDYSFNVSLYLGQISADSSPGQSRKVFIATWTKSNFTSGSDCQPQLGSKEFNATNIIQGALANDPAIRGGVPGGHSFDIIGMNSTLGVRITLNIGTFIIEEMWQCAYVTFVSTEKFPASRGGICNSGTTIDPVVAALLPANLSSTLTTPISPPTANSEVTSSSLSPKTGIIVLVSAAALVTAVFYLVIWAILSSSHRTKYGEKMTLSLFFAEWVPDPYASHNSSDQSFSSSKSNISSMSGSNGSYSMRSESLPQYWDATNP